MSNKYLDIAIEKVVKQEVNAVLDKIRTEIKSMEINGYIRDVECFSAGINAALNVINKYREER